MLKLPTAVTYGHSLAIFLICMLFFSSCQKDEFLKEKENTVLTQQETSLRSSPECEICPELIENGDFSLHCVGEPNNDALCTNQNQHHFKIPNCVDGAWVNCTGSPDICDDSMIAKFSEFAINHSSFGGVNHSWGESAYYEFNFKSGIDYCLDLDFMIEESTFAGQSQGNIEDWQLCVYTSNNLAEDLTCDIRLHPSPYPTPFTDMSLVNASNEIECFQFSSADNQAWKTYSLDFNLTSDYSQLWAIAIPDGNLNPNLQNYYNKVYPYFDNFSMHCKSEQLIGIGSTKAGCTYTFWADERPNSDIAIESWAWDFGDGQTDMGDDITHTYTEAGTYTVTLYIVDENGCCHTEEIEVNCEIIDADYCKYICHEDYIGHIKCANGFVYKDIVTGQPTPQPFINGSYLQTDFEGIAEDIQSYFNSIGADMIVTPTHPTGEILCYKSICLGCPYTGNDGIEVIPSWSTDFFVVDADGVPTGQIVPNYTQVLGTIQSHPQWNGAEWVVIEATITIIINVYFDATTVVVTQNPGGGYLIEYGYTDGIFAIGDHELLTITGSDTWNGSNCNGSTTTNASVPFFDSCNE